MAGRRMLRSRDAFALRDILIGIVIFGTTLLLVETQLRGSDAVWRGTLCQSNSRQIGMALFMYSADYDGRLPASAGSFNGMVTSTRPYLRDDSRFHCPETGAAQSADSVGFLTPGLYAGLPIAAGWPDPYLGGQVADPGRTVLLYEARSDRSTNFAPAYRHSGGAVCLLFTGQSFWVRDFRASK